MKTLLMLRWQSLVLPAMLMLSSMGLSQPSGFIPMDETMGGLLHFYQTDTILVVYPNQYSISQKDREAIESLVFWQEKPLYQYKSQSELTAVDTEKHLQFFGPAYRFIPDSLFDIPISINQNGFSWQGRSFNDPADAFYYMNESSQRIYTCRNGEENQLAYISFFAAPYQCYIFSGNEIEFSGFSSNPPQFNDMDALRKEYFCEEINSRFFKLHFACSINNANISNTLGEELDSYVTNLCRYLAVNDDSIKPVTTYFYNTREDLQYFIAAPMMQTIYGKSFGDINHISGLNLDVFKHEAGHSIIESTLGKHPSAFYSEGFRQYTDYFFNKKAYDDDIQVCRENRELLNLNLIVSDNAVFFTNFFHYNISGVFVKYLIDQLGYEEFKAAYSQQNIDTLIAAKGFTLANLIDDFKRTLL